MPTGWAVWLSTEWRSLQPISHEDIQEVHPAPDLPPLIDAQWQRAQHILFLIRRSGPPELPRNHSLCPLLLRAPTFRMPACRCHPSTISIHHGYLAGCCRRPCMGALSTAFREQFSHAMVSYSVSLQQRILTAGLPDVPICILACFLALNLRLQSCANDEL